MGEELVVPDAECGEGEFCANDRELIPPTVAAPGPVLCPFSPSLLRMNLRSAVSTSPSLLAHAMTPSSIWEKSSARFIQPTRTIGDCCLLIMKEEQPLGTRRSKQRRVPSEPPENNREEDCEAAREVIAADVAANDVGLVSCSSTGRSMTQISLSTSQILMTSAAPAHTIQPLYCIHSITILT